MALDPYRLCPCGSGKKIKFCCSKDLVSELDKVVRAVEGEQRVAALDQIERLIEQNGERTALLALKADVQLALEDQEGAEQTIAALQKNAPHNPTALGLGAILAASRQETDLAVEKLQEALENSDMISTPVYSAIGLVAMGLLQAGDVLAARGHWLMQAGMAGDRDSQPTEMLMRINLAAEVPTLLKSDPMYADCPPGVPWQGEFNAAMKSARRGAWLAACESLESLAQKAADQPAIRRNIAILRGWLGQTELACEAWHAYAHLDGVPFDDAVEAEALAQMLSPENPADELDAVTLTYSVRNSEELMEALLSNKRVAQIPVDLAELADEDQPPPKGAFWLLDRPAAESEDVGLDDIPYVLGEIYLFGKQTDRDARLEFSAARTEHFAETQSALDELVAEFVEVPATEKVEGSVSAITEALTWRWHLPKNTGPQQRLELIKEQQQEVMLNRWPQLQLSVLDGKRPTEAAADPAYRIRLLAAILLLEMASETQPFSFDYDQLREKLELPVPTAIQVGGDALMRLSAPQMTRVDAQQLADQDLVNAFQKSVLKGHRAGIVKFGEEVLCRDTTEPLIRKLDVYEPLIRNTRDNERALQHVKEARKLSVKSGESPARWLLTELSLQLARADIDECNRLVQILRGHHLQEPGVAENLYKLLVSHGVIDPQGQPGMPSQPSPPPAAETADAAAKLWQPGDDLAPSAAEPKEKSKLWVPGMD